MSHPAVADLTLYQFEADAALDCGCRLERANEHVHLYFCFGHAVESRKLKIVRELEADK